MYILALNGSPHRHGNTAYLLEAVLHEAEKSGCETQLIIYRRLSKSRNSRTAGPVLLPARGNVTAIPHWHRPMPNSEKPMP